MLATDRHRHTQTALTIDEGRHQTHGKQPQQAKIKTLCALPSVPLFTPLNIILWSAAGGFNRGGSK
jgi:hypothetical protein